MDLVIFSILVVYVWISGFYEIEGYQEKFSMNFNGM